MHKVRTRIAPSPAGGWGVFELRALLSGQYGKICSLPQASRAGFSGRDQREKPESRHSAPFDVQPEFSGAQGFDAAVHRQSAVIAGYDNYRTWRPARLNVRWNASLEISP
jgi:hypothetical protein